jgi:hypothetical protein
VAVVVAAVDAHSMGVTVKIWVPGVKRFMRNLRITLLWLAVVVDARVVRVARLVVGVDRVAAVSNPPTFPLLPCSFPVIPRDTQRAR